MTITVRLPDDLEIALRARLDTTNVALSEFVRQAIAEKLEREPVPEKPSAYELGKHLFGRYSSGRTDVSENTRKYVREAIIAKHRRRRNEESGS